jgi:hypothetical protein
MTGGRLEDVRGERAVGGRERDLSVFGELHEPGTCTRSRGRGKLPA